MGQDRSILKAITCKDYRKQVESMLDGGWDAARTGRNHFRLTHPEAQHSIITSGTPSDHRSTANLRAQAKRAMRSTTAIPEKPQNATVDLAPTVAAFAGPALRPPGKRKPRWDKAARAKRTERLEAPQQIGTELPFSHKPQTIAECENSKFDNIGKDVALSFMENQIAPSPRQATKAQPAKTRTGAPLDAGKHPAAPVSALAPADVAPAPMVQAPVASAKVAPVSHGLTPLDGALLAVAMRIISGELRAISITPDMVGKSIILGAEGWIADLPQTSPAPIVLKVATPAEPAVVVNSTAAPEKPVRNTSGLIPTTRLNLETDPLALQIVEAFEAFKGEWLTPAAICGLATDQTKTHAQHSQNVRKRLAALVDAGRAERRPTSLRKIMEFRLKG